MEKSKNRQNWEAHEVRILKSELEKGTPVKRIAEILGRSFVSVNNKKRVLGLHVNRINSEVRQEWTTKECELFCKVMINNWTNIAEASRIVAAKTSKTPKQVMNKWYNLKYGNKVEEFFREYYDPNFQMCFMTVGMNGSIVNGKVAVGTTTVKNNKASLWKRLISLFK